MDRLEFEKRFTAARRAAISLDFTHLNDIQREAALTTGGPLLLLAGAGSGKTTVLMNRIANLLKYGSGSDSDYVPDSVSEDDLAFLEHHVKEAAKMSGSSNPGLRGPDADTRVRALCTIDPVEPWRILAITFTNKAAGEMKHRLERMLGPGSEDVWALTFHSACARILRRDIDRLGYERSFTIYDTSDTASLMKRILKDFGIEERNLPHKMVLGYISRSKDAMVSAEDFLSEAEIAFDSRKKIIGRAYLEYTNRMRASNSLDFDDLILLTVMLFMENPDILEHYQKRFKYVLVDEYQDTNNLQYLLASRLAGGHRNICVVGDDDQSIYKFRGATIENILSFETHYHDARVIRLEQNYRSTAFILGAANDVIRNNKGRKGKKLWTDKDSGEKPSLYVVEDERVEAQFVADEIVASVSSGKEFKEHTVLYRMNAQSNQFETAFKRSGIPYRIFGGTGFYDRAEIKDMLAYLCIIHNPQDDVRLLRVLNNPPRGIGPTTVGRLSELAAELGKTIIETIRESHHHDSLKGAAGRLHQFADLIDELRSIEKDVTLDELYDALVKRTGYIRSLEEKPTDENLTRIENVKELKTNIVGFMKDSNNDNGGGLFDFLSETALLTDLDRDDQSSDRVLMMTMHSAKGLEFDTVFIVGAEEGIFPGMRTIGDPAEMEEERRLCYVAMTRAMRKLYFTSTKRRMLFGKTASAQPSRFVREISTENIEIYESKSSFNGFDFDSYQAPGESQGLGPRAKGLGTGGQKPGPTAVDSTAKRDDSRTANGRPYASRAPYQPTRPNTSSSHFGATSPEPLPLLTKGDAIIHSAFGSGVIIKAEAAGGDVLLEIAFETEGTKRMLLNSTARYLKKQ